MTPVMRTEERPAIPIDQGADLEAADWQWLSRVMDEVMEVPLLAEILEALPVGREGGAQ